jgi:6-phosphofructokinase 2
VKNVIVECQNETRESIEIYETFSGKQFRLVMPNSNLTTNEWEELLKALVEIKQIDFMVVSGSFPTNSPTDIFKRLVQIADSKKAKLIVDTSGESLKKAIQEPLYLIKPNLEEFGYLIENKDLKIPDLKVAAMTFLEKNKCELVVISLGKKGAVLYSKFGSYHIKAPKVVVKSTVGAGDSMLAGIIYGLSLDMGLKECLEHCVAFGTATTLQNGTALCTQKDVEELLPNIVNQR